MGKVTHHPSASTYRSWHKLPIGVIDALVDYDNKKILLRFSNRRLGLLTRLYLSIKFIFGGKSITVPLSFEEGKELDFFLTSRITE